VKSIISLCLVALSGDRLYENTSFKKKGKINFSEYVISGGQGLVGEEATFTINLNFIKSK
jgi:hypothetical protein